MTIAERMKNRLLAQFVDKKLIEGFLETIAEELAVIQNTTEDLKTLRWIDSSFGRQLDGCGDIVGQPRIINKAVAVPFFGFPNHGDRSFGEAPFRRLNDTYLTSATLSDENYRLILWAKVYKNTTDGTADSTIQSLVRLFNVGVIVVDAGNAKIRITIKRPLLEGEMLLINALNLIVRAGGVGYEFLSWQHRDFVFGFSRLDGSDKGVFYGFGIGRFARLVN